MKAQEIREMSQDERQNRIADLRKRLFELRSQAVTETLENSKAMRNIRRDIARVLTIINEKK